MTNFDLEYEVTKLHTDPMDRERFEKSAIGNKPYVDERRPFVLRQSQQQQCLNALKHYEESPNDWVNKMGVYRELADLFFKEQKAEIVYQDIDLKEKIQDVRLSMQRTATSRGIKSPSQLIYRITKDLYGARVENLNQGLPVVDVEKEVHLIFETYKNFKNGSQS